MGFICKLKGACAGVPRVVVQSTQLDDVLLGKFRAFTEKVYFYFLIAQAQEQYLQLAFVK